MRGDLAVIFDMDGVLVHSNPYQKRAWRQFFLNHGFNLSEDELKLNVFGKIDSEILRNYFKEISDEQIQQYRTEKRELYRKFIGFNLTAPKGLNTFLFDLRRESVCMAVATSSCPEDVEFVLGSLGITRYFNFIMDDTHVSNGKPHPEVYLKTAETIGYLPEKCVVIEDSLAGIKAGLDAGMKVVGITTTHTKKELSNADIVIDDFSELNLEKLILLLNK